MTSPPVTLSFLLSLKRAVDESEMEAAERRTLRCVWVTGGRALTEQEAAAAIVAEARVLLQDDLAQLGIQWDPSTLPAPAVNATDDHLSGDPSSACVNSQPAPPQVTADHGPPSRRREENWLKGGVGAGQNQVVERKEDICEVEETPAERDTTEHQRRMNVPNENEEEHHDGRRHKSPQRRRQLRKEEPSPVSVRPEPNRPTGPERSLTQELSEIVSSPSFQLQPPPEPGPPPLPPPRFRAPTSRAEGQRVCTSNVSVSAVQTDQGKHSRVLSKVLHSIQTDKDLHRSTTSTPQVSTPPVEPGAKRRRREGDGEVDTFSSPELYAGPQDPKTSDHVRKEEETFGDSFELDTQTERIIAQPEKELLDNTGGDGGTRPMGTGGDEGLEAPDVDRPKFHISLTDSQMELILDTSHQVSEQSSAHVFTRVHIPVIREQTVPDP